LPTVYALRGKKKGRKEKKRKTMSKYYKKKCKKLQLMTLGVVSYLIIEIEGFLQVG
jgi:hypothetical protein